MWRLLAEIGGGDNYYFLTGTEYIVGRKNCAILMQDDQSISRAHAILSVSHSHSNLVQPNVIPALTIKDSSKYGTFINGEKMENSVPRNLKSGDKVTFGVFNSKYRVEYEPLVVSSSCLNGPEKESLNQALLQLGGHVLGNWTGECTHLAMSSIKITIKTICALICCRPIVLPEYFNEQIKCIKQKQTLPPLASFMPFVDEPSLKSQPVDLSVNVKRKCVFKNKVFLFLSAKQFKKLSPAVTLGGGESKLLKEGLNDPSLLENPKICVVDTGMIDSQLSVSDPTQTWTSSVVDVLQSKNLRAISEAEIGLAVLHVSTDMYCNPRRRLESGNETSTCKTNIICQSMAVDETLLPAPTFNITAYVTNTEPQEETNTVMDISGVREVKETPKSNHKESHSKADSEMSPSNRNIVTGDLFKENVVAEKFHRELSEGELGANKRKTSQKSLLTNPIKNFFHPISKKRDREEGESNTSFAKMENFQPPSKKSVVSQQFEDKRSLMSQVANSELETEPVLPDSDKFQSSNSLPSEKDGASKKRKELEEDLVEESDLESEGDDKTEQSDVKCSIMTNVKRMRLETTENNRLETTENNRLETTENNRLETTENNRGFQQASESTNDIHTLTKEIKKEPGTQNAEKKFLSQPKEHEFDKPPNKVLLTEFKCLVVGRPSRNGQVNASASLGNALNFKKFKKVAYPGAEGFPRIIGGSDLVAHDRKKNSELEQWLRQEVEEQTQRAREESIAEDLFRYNPNSKRRR